MTFFLFVQPFLTVAMLSGAQNASITPPNAVGCSCDHCGSKVCTAIQLPPKPKVPTHYIGCVDRVKARCELVLGRQYAAKQQWGEAAQHCGGAMGSVAFESEAMDCFRQAIDHAALNKDTGRRLRSGLLASRLKVIAELTERGALDAAENEISDLRKHLHDEDGKLDQISFRDGERIDEAAECLAKMRYPWWIQLANSIARFWEHVPSVVPILLKIALYLSGMWFVCFFLKNLRNQAKKNRWGWVHEPDTTLREIRWSVTTILDETKQLAAGTLMDALNVDHNPLFQNFEASSLLSLPPSLFPDAPFGTTTDLKCRNVEGENQNDEPEMTVIRNFMILDGQDEVRASLSERFEGINLNAFKRHSFEQVDAFDDLTVKLVGMVEGSLGSVLSAIRRWWTKGWPTVSGSVIIETVKDEGDYASVRLMCNFDLARANSQNIFTTELQTYDPNLISSQELFEKEKTLAVFASTKIERYTDAVDLAAQRAAFRLLYRLAKNPKEPQLAIAASSYRQGVRLLMTAL